MSNNMMSEKEKKLLIDPAVEGCRQYLAEISKEKFRITEFQFVRDILPFLAGEETNVDIRFWFHQTGSFLKPIYVYKGDQELFRVPPLFNRDAVALSERSDDLDSIAADIATANNKRAISEYQSNQFLYQAFEARINNGVDYLAELKEINDILVRYGKPPIRLSPEAEEFLPGLIPTGGSNEGPSTNSSAASYDFEEEPLD